ncbi:hypothetical protein PACTADRAFT_48852 [Pachysolen tannophilus NRRL Y-2460]|uniref:ABC transporter domain-containing protein n=1 Tax=Pachysolen tannophilus NRRL Y-2460 TaxID=669874 RepID=A0A1E4TZC6_PACTA|nr:hypothetical protein PACTADRAFT_48852 [Pachysolen tannophilus NRRL Y-2460]
MSAPMEYNQGSGETSESNGKSSDTYSEKDVDSFRGPDTLGGGGNGGGGHGGFRGTFRGRVSHGSGGVEGTIGDGEYMEDDDEGAEADADADAEATSLGHYRGDALTRLSTLSKTLSHMTAKDMNNFVIDKNDFDLQELLALLAGKAEEQGIQFKEIGVEMSDVSVLGVDDSTSVVVTAGDIAMGPFLGLQKLFSRGKNDAKKEKKTGDDKYRKILRNINCLVNPGEMCLVLGRPGAGCSSFLKVVAGENEQFVKVNGDITYNNISQPEMMKNFKKDVIYNPELDVHFPFLTVNQTLRFAIGCRTPSIRVDNISREKYITTMRDLWCTVFGLTHTLNTRVGNDFVRGVSGGERKRVSIAEAMATQGKIFCWDNATRGLDASTALEYSQAIRTSTNLSKISSFVTIYQAGENIYEKFDKVTVLYQGRQVYFGPATDAKSYFENMGFECPARQSTAEFLTAVTDPIGRFPKPGFENKVPKTAAEFEEYWLNSNEYHQLMRDIQDKRAKVSPDETKEAFVKSKQQEKMKYQRSTSRYTINFFMQLKLCTIRGFQKIINDRSYTVTTVAAAIIQSLIVGSLYWKTPSSTEGAFGRGGCMFYSCLYFSLMGLTEMPTVFSDRPILLKQKGYSFYHPSAEILSETVTLTPIKFLSVVCFGLIVYFLADLKVDAGAFFTYILFVNLNAQVVSAMFKMLAAFCSTISAANAVSGVMMLSTILYSSYMIQRPSMVPWFKWFSYMNPVLFGFEAIITTEFHGRHMECQSDLLVPSGTGYENVSSANQVCAFTGSDGSTVVDGDTFVYVSYTYKFWHVWRNFGILCCFWIGFITINCILTELLKQSKGGGDHLSFIRGARIPDTILNPADVAPSSDVENGPLSEKDTTENEVDNAKKPVSKAVAEDGERLLGSDEIFMWQHVDYVIPYKGSTRKLLDDIQGYVKPGTLTALMGESGAGKTTLLNTLSQRNEVGVITGDILVNGRSVDNSFQRRTGYVQQQDLHIAELTVRESLRFAARLRRPLSVPDAEKMEYVEEIINILQMQDYADAVAGDPGYGLNVEQRKKLSIATELVAKPDLLLFLDEPTSGLDSQSAWAIVQLLRSLANAGQAILCTIHQPSATLFEQFDRLLLLRKGGQTVYFGDIGKNSETILSYFERNGARHCEPHENPAEYILEAIGAGATAAVQENWYEKWTQSKEFNDTTVEVTKLIESTQASNPEESVNKNAGIYATPYWYQFRLVVTRTATQFYRDLDYIMAKFMLFLTGALLIGFSYWNLKHTRIGLQNCMFAVFISMILSAPLGNQVQARAIASRELFEVRESKSNTFHWSTLLIAQFLNEIPYSLLFSTMYFVIFYFTVQLDNNVTRSGVFWLNYSFFFQFYYVSFSLWVVYMSPDLPSANVLFSLFFNFIVSFCGVVQPEYLMVGFWTFMYKISPFTYFVQTMVSLVLHDREVHCATDELSILQPPSGETCGSYLEEYLSSNYGYVSNPDATSDCGYCAYSVADQYLDIINIKYVYRWRNVGFYCAFILFNLSAMIICYYIFRVKKYSPVSLVKPLISKVLKKRE